MTGAVEPRVCSLEGVHLFDCLVVRQGGSSFDVRQFAHTHTNTHPQTHTLLLFHHPPDPAKASAAGPTAAAAGPSPGEGAKASGGIADAKNRRHR